MISFFDADVYFAFTCSRLYFIAAAKRSEAEDVAAASLSAFAAPNSKVGHHAV